MHEQSQHVREDADAQAERAIILRLLDPGRAQPRIPDALTHAIAEEDPLLDAAQVIAATEHLEPIGLLRNEGAKWHASCGLRRLDRLGMIAV